MFVTMKQDEDEPEVIFDPEVGRFVPPRERRPIKKGEMVRFLVRPPVLGALTFLFATGCAVWAEYRVLGIGLFSDTVHGANIDLALILGFLGGLVGFALVLIVSRRRRLLIAMLLLGAANLSVAVALVAADAATYRTTDGVGRFATEHLTYLYFLWGFAITLLLLQAARVVRLPWPREMPQHTLLRPRGGWPPS